MQNSKINIYLPGLLLILIVFSSCSEYQKLLKSDDNALKYQRALEYYEKGDFGRSITLLNDIIPAYRGTAEAEIVNYHYSMAHFYQGDYAMASHYFSSYANAFPRSEHAEEFLYLSAYCQYLISPKYSLDQSSSLQAVRELQNFINRYPDSDRVEDANRLIDELRLKLQRKHYETAMMYMDIIDFQAAATSFDNLIKDFPDTDFREEALFMIVKARFEHADNSVVQRQMERFRLVLTAHQNLIRHFPESQYLEESLEMRDESLRQMEALEQMERNQVTENNQ